MDKASTFSHNWSMLFRIASNVNNDNGTVFITDARCPKCNKDTLNIKYKDRMQAMVPDVVVCTNTNCVYNNPYVTISLLSDVATPFEHTNILRSTLIDENGVNVFKSMPANMQSIPVGSQKISDNRPFLPLDLAKAVRQELSKVEIRKGNYVREFIDEDKLREMGHDITWPFDMTKDELTSVLKSPPNDSNMAGDKTVVTASIERVDDDRIEKLLDKLQKINSTLEKPMSPNQVYSKYHEILRLVRKNKDLIDVRLLNDVASNIVTLYDFISHHEVDKIELSRYRTALQGYLGSFLIRVTDVVARLLHNEPTHKEPTEDWHMPSLTPNQYKGKTTRSFGRPMASVSSMLTLADESSNTLSTGDIKKVYALLKIKAKSAGANDVVDSLCANYQKYNDMKTIYMANDTLPDGFEKLANDAYMGLKKSFVEAVEVLR